MMSPEGTRPDRSLEQVELPWIWLWFGTVAGLLEVGVLLVRRHVGGQFIWVSRDFVWMTPLAYVLFFTPVAVTLWIATRRSSTRARLRIATSSFAFLAALSLLLLFGGLHRLAAALLAAGLAVQTGRWIGEHPDRFSRLVRRSTPALLAALVISGLGLRGRDYLEERRALADLPPAAAGAPNILLIILDTVRAQNMSLYGYERATTPHLERWAERGIVFERAISTAPWTLPSHGTMFTGRYPHELEADWKRPLGDRFPTLAERLRARGYLTAGFVANFYYTTRESGLDRGFIHYEDHLASLQQILLSSSAGQLVRDALRRMGEAGSPGSAVRALLETRLPTERWGARKDAARINRDFLDWLRASPDRPFFAFLNYFDAHLPYEPPAPFDTIFGGPDDDMAGYDGAIAYSDRHLAGLLDELDRDGVFSNTLVLVTSDHGELLGEHGLRGHTRSLYMPLLHIPLVVLPPDAGGRALRVDVPVSLADLAPTIAEYTRVEPHGMDGRSLRRFWHPDRYRGRLSGPDTLLSEYGQRGLKSLYTGSLHYIRHPDGEEELYDLKSDPDETRNLAELGGREEELARLRSTLPTRLAATQIGNRARPERLSKKPERSGSAQDLGRAQLSEEIRQ